MILSSLWGQYAIFYSIVKTNSTFHEGTCTTDGVPYDVLTSGMLKFFSSIIDVTKFSSMSK